MHFLARIDDKHRTQTLKEHLWAVKEKCEMYGSNVGMKHLAGLTGVLHDFGKLNPRWQHYIQESSPNEKMDHSTCGAIFLCKRYYFVNHSDPQYNTCRKFIVEAIANAICGHHSQLCDGLDLDGNSPFVKRLLKEEIADIPSLLPLFEQEVMTLEELDAYVHEATLEYQQLFQDISNRTTAKGKEKRLPCFSPLFVHHLHSMLVDADRNDAREWQWGKSKAYPKLTDTLFLKKIEQELNNYLKKLQHESTISSINQLRQQISDECFRAGKWVPNIYRLATPVGAGKTIASLRFALEHAKVHQKERIIYILPFTSVIEQNAEEVRNILKAQEWLLEHHGQVLFDTGNPDIPFSLSIAKDNWDAPIIFTTMYQYLMAVYGGKGRYSRRFHNLTNSILIFDEVQSIPPESISLFNESVNYLYEVGNSTILLCTATQPTLNQVTHQIRSEIRPIVKDEMKLASAFKRVDFYPIPKPMNNKQLCFFIKEKLQDLNSILVILNTKKVVRDLYQRLIEANLDTPVYHLSTNMCPAHRTKVLNQVKKHLKKKEKVILVSTPLIEAGVNISFQAVIRSLSGLDSIAQASGRCNRHGELHRGEMYLIQHSEEQLDQLRTIQIGKEVTQDMLDLLRIGKPNWHGDLISPEAMTRYYQRYFKRVEKYLDFPVTTKDNRTISLYSFMFQNHRSRLSYCPPVRVTSQGFLDLFTEHLYRSTYPFLLDSAFRTVFEHFNVYGDEQIAVIVSYGKGKQWIEYLQSNMNPSNWQKEIQPYTIQLPKEVVDKFIGQGEIEKMDIHSEQYVYKLKEEFYDEDLGFLK